jgi:hypothetical protein
MKTKCLLVASSLLYCAPNYAAPGCIASNLNGNYVMYQNSVGAANLHTGSCKITVLSGVVSGNCAFTTAPGGVITPGFTGPVTGTASINANCSAAMQIDFNPAPNVNVHSYFDLQFTPDKQSYIGQWTNSFGLLGTTAGTRYSPLLPSTPAPQN